MSNPEQPQHPEYEDREEQRQRIAVWVGDLASYNAGILHGEWLEADVEPDELWDGINRVLRTSPTVDAEEHFFADYEGFEGIRVGEYDSVERVTTLAKLVAEHGEAFARWFENDPSVELEEAAEKFTDSYIGCFTTPDELQEHLFEDFGIESMMEEVWKLVPESWQVYVVFNMEGMVRDLEYGGEMFTVEGRDGTVYAYWANR